VPTMQLTGARRARRRATPDLDAIGSLRPRVRRPCEGVTGATPSRRGAPWAEALVALALVACTVGARAPLLDYPFWQDEIATARVVQQPTLRAVEAQIVLREATPPAFYVTAWAAERLFGPERVPGKWLRLISLACAVGTTLVTFRLARRLLPLWAAALAGLLVSLASELVFQGAQVRAYSMLAFASVLFVLVLLRAVERPRPLRLAALAGVVLVGSLTHYFFLLTVAAGLAWLLSSAPARAVWLRACGAIAVGLAGLAAWSPEWLSQYRMGGYSTSPPFSLHRVAEVVGTQFASQPLVADAGTAGRGAIVAAVVGSAAALVAHPREGRLYGLLVLVPLGATAAVAAAGPLVLNTRNLLSVAPFASIAVAWTCAALPRRRLGHAAAACLAVLAVVSFCVGGTSARRVQYEAIARQVTMQGFSHGEPLVWFGSWSSHIPVGWYAVSPDASSRTSTGLLTVRTTRARGRCAAVEVVAGTARGRAWIQHHSSDVVRSSTVSGYGDWLLGRPGPVDATVARLRFSPTLLGEARLAGGVVFRRYDVGSACS
jgi:hypothetical protein